MPLSSLVGPDLAALYALFPASPPPPHAHISGGAMPQPYRDLLVHTHHMTVAVERHHGGPVDVRVIDRVRTGDRYARKIMLHRRSDGTPVQFGIVRIRLEFCAPAVRDAILEERTPLGRVLIEHDVLRRIEPTGYLRVTAAGELQTLLGLAEPRETYGRLGTIFCDGEPAVDVLEVVAPEASAFGP